MSSEWFMNEPQSLFTLPHPIDKVAGDIRAGRVYGAQGSQKRKRAEVVVGVDGECINVYSIKTPRLLTTYSLPPQTYLTSSPVSFCRQAQETLLWQRFTYAATRKGLGHNQGRELLCFQDQIGTHRSVPSANVVKPLKWTRDVTSTEFEVIHIEPLLNEPSTSQSQSHDVLVVHGNGKLAVLSDDLQTEKLQGSIQIQPLADESGLQHDLSRRVELVSVQTFGGGKNGLLRGRPDLAAGFDASDSLVLLVTSLKEAESKAIYEIQVFSVPRSSARQQYQGFLSPIWSCTLPYHADSVPTFDRTCDSQFRYEERSASLYQLTDRELHVYDLSSTFPKVISKFRNSHGRYGQLIPLSRSMVLFSSGKRCFLYDVRYGSLQATRKVQGSSVSSPFSRKRKRTMISDGDENILFWFSYSSAGVVLGLIGHDLVSMRVSSRSGRKNRHTSNLLIDSLGLSGGPTAWITSDKISKEQGEDFCHSEAQAAWKETLSKLSTLPAAETATYFDQAFLDIVNATAISFKGPLAPTYRDLALKAIRVIFEWNPEAWNELSAAKPGKSCLKVVLVARNTIRWLAQGGYLGSRTVEKALSAASLDFDESPLTVKEIDIVRAITTADPQLGLLAKVVTSKRLGLTGFVESLKILLESFDGGHIEAQNGLLETANGLTSEEPEKMLIIEQEAAHHDLQVATALLEDESDARGIALKTSLERLGTCFSPPELVEAFRRQMVQREIMVLIDLLRIELEQAGWTSRRLDFHPSFDETESQNEAIAVICRLLNCALDAMGATAWLEGQDSIDGEEMSTSISLLRAQSSAVLEGVQECTFFTEFLKDFLRFHEALVNSTGAVGKDRSSLTGIQVGQSCLPMGSVSSGVSLTRVGAGGELQKRSARRIGLELSRQVGKYQFETIRI